MSTSRTIDRNDYNTLVTRINEILGTGKDPLGNYISDATRGYGQSVITTALPEPPTPVTIQEDQWDSLYFDLLSILIHQTGNTPLIPNISDGEVVRLGAAFPLSAYESALTLADANRFNLALSQSIISPGGSATYSSAWSSRAETTVTVTFPSAEQARYFFNSGGKIRFSSSRTGGSNTSQNSSWTNLLNSAGTIEFSANPSNFNFYNLTGSYLPFVQISAGSGFYNANNFKIEARCNISNNSASGATIIYFKISWLDDYVDLKPSLPNDQVDGVLTLTVEEQKASGTLQPSGSFTISSPTYNVSSITAS